MICRAQHRQLHLLSNRTLLQRIEQVPSIQHLPPVERNNNVPSNNATQPAPRGQQASSSSSAVWVHC